MTIKSVGINNESIQYEVALDILGADFQPLMAALEAEQSKPNKSLATIEYLKSRLKALHHLQDDLSPSDRDTIESILDSSNHIYRL